MIEIMTSRFPVNSFVNAFGTKKIGVMGKEY